MLRNICGKEGSDGMIRIAKESDAAQMLAIYAPYVEDTTVSFEYTVPSLEEFTGRIGRITRQFPWLVYEENGQILGYAYASLPFERKAYGFIAEPSIYLREDAAGRGIGGKLYAVLEEILRRQGYQTLYALITQENTRSVHFHEKAGYRTFAVFERSGYKFGRWLGVCWMKKDLNVVENPSCFPVDWMTVVNSVKNTDDILASLSLS